MGVPPSPPKECIRQIGVGQSRFQLTTIPFCFKAPLPSYTASWDGEV